MTQGVITPQTVMNCGPELFPNHPNVFRDDSYPYGRGPTDVVSGIEESCDVFFYTVGMKLGLTRLVAGYRSYGLGSPTGIGLAEETGGYLPPTDNSISKIKRLDDAIMMGIGQGPIAVTPLQMANGYTALLRGGLWRQPQLIEQLHRPPPRKININTSYLKYIYKGMYLVVHGPLGTANTVNFTLPVEGKPARANSRTGPAKRQDNRCKGR